MMPVAVYKVLRPSVHEEVRFAVHDVARLHTNSVDCRYQLGLSASCLTEAPRRSGQVCNPGGRSLRLQLQVHRTHHWIR